MTTTFEDRLGAELRAIVAATPAPALTPEPSRRPGRRRGLALGGLAAAATATALVLLQGGASPAYAVEKAADGTVTVTISRTDDAAGLQKALRDKGVEAYVDYLPAGKTCAPGRYTPVQGQIRTQGSIRLQDDRMTFSITSSQLEDSAVVIQATADGDLGAMSIGFASGAVKDCEPVDGSIGPEGEQSEPGTGPHSVDGGGLSTHLETAPAKTA